MSDSVGKLDKCEHGRYGYEECMSCVYEESRREIEALTSEVGRRVDDLLEENRRLRDGYRRIRQATLDGTVCDDVAWFYGNETLHDYCERMAESPPEFLP